MLIEIHGAGFANKGAQLMLEKTIATLAERNPDYRFCIAAGRDRPPEEVGNLGLKFIWPSKILEGRKGKFKPLFLMTNILSSFVSEARLKPYGLIKRSQVDGLIDISGFGFSDMWGPGPIRNFSLLAKYYADRDRPVVMLPQMLGPFDEDTNQNLFKTMTSYCNLIYARDTKSYAIAQKYATELSNVLLAPDITLFQSEALNQNSPDRSNTVVLVPNMRVLDMGTDWKEATYLAAMIDVGNRALANQYNVEIMIHETLGQDASLAEKIREGLGLSSSSIFANEDPKKLKEKISQSAFLVGSRFHSLAGALSTLTPTISIGWAHKYGQLLSDFGVGDFDIPSAADAHKIPSLIDSLLDDTQRKSITDRINDHKIKLTETNEAMWDRVTDVFSTHN